VFHIIFAFLFRTIEFKSRYHNHQERQNPDWPPHLAPVTFLLTNSKQTTLYNCTLHLPQCTPSTLIYKNRFFLETLKKFSDQSISQPKKFAKGKISIIKFLNKTNVFNDPSPVYSSRVGKS
jgi:hypothetical protein